jgi:hypothetical protein
VTGDLLNARGEGGGKAGGGLVTVTEHGRRNSVVPQFFGKKAAFRRFLVDEAAFRCFLPVPEHFKSVGTVLPQLWAGGAAPPKKRRRPSLEPLRIS